MKTIEEYIKIWETLHNKKLEEMTKAYIEDGEDLNDTTTKQSLEEDAYYYFFSEEFENSVEEDTFVDTIVGLRLMEENADPKAAYDAYMDGYEYNELETTGEKRIADTLLSLCTLVS